MGYYNRGLTLVEGPAFPGDEAGALTGLSMRIKSRYLEHTLTRDNVLQDENYDYVHLQSLASRTNSAFFPIKVG